MYVGIYIYVVCQLKYMNIPNQCYNLLMFQHHNRCVLLHPTIPVDNMILNYDIINSI